MNVTESGFEVIPDYGDPRIQLITVDGVAIRPGVLRGDVAIILRWVAAQFDATVQPLVSGQCFGYAPRQIRGGTGWSNHASGTAIDLNGANFPQGTRNMTGKQYVACMTIQLSCHGVVRWGGSYVAPTEIDEQHWEINDNMAGTARLAVLAATIRNGNMTAPQDILAETIKVRDPFTTPPDRTLTVEDVLADTYNSARVAARDTAIIRKKLGV